MRDNAATLQKMVTYDAVIDVDNTDLALRPAMTANVSFVYATRAHAVRVANADLRFRPDPATVAAMTGGTPTTPFSETMGRDTVLAPDSSAAAPLVLIDAALLAFGFSAVVGLVFGSYPARKAARLDPIETLRFE